MASISPRPASCEARRISAISRGTLDGAELIQDRRQVADLARRGIASGATARSWASRDGPAVPGVGRDGRVGGPQLAAALAVPLGGCERRVDRRARAADELPHPFLGQFPGAQRRRRRPSAASPARRLGRDHLPLGTLQPRVARGQERASPCGPCRPGRDRRAAFRSRRDGRTRWSAAGPGSRWPWVRPRRSRRPGRRSGRRRYSSAPGIPRAGNRSDRAADRRRATAHGQAAIRTIGHNERRFMSMILCRLAIGRRCYHFTSCGAPVKINEDVVFSATRSTSIRRSSGGRIREPSASRSVSRRPRSSQPRSMPIQSPLR